MHVSLLCQKELEPPEHTDDMIQNSQKTLEPTGPTLTGSPVPAGAEPSWHPGPWPRPHSPHCTLSSPNPAGWASSPHMAHAVLSIPERGPSAHPLALVMFPQNLPPDPPVYFRTTSSPE